MTKNLDSRENNLIPNTRVMARVGNKMQVKQKNVLKSGAWSWEWGIGFMGGNSRSTDFVEIKMGYNTYGKGG